MLSTEWLSIVPWVPMEAITLPLFGLVAEPMSNGMWPMMMKLEASHGLKSQGRSPSCYCMRQWMLSHHWSRIPPFGRKPSDSKQLSKTAINSLHLGDGFEHFDLWFVPRSGDCLKRNKFRKRLAEKLRRSGAAGAAMSLECGDRLLGLMSRCPSPRFARVMVVAPANHIDLAPNELLHVLGKKLQKSKKKHALDLKDLWKIHKNSN